MTAVKRLSSSPLIVVDVQDHFISQMGRRKAKYLRRVLAVVEAAKEARRPIFLLEYFDFGPTHPKVTEALAGYRRKFVVQKHQDDGSAQVQAVMMKKLGAKTLAASQRLKKRTLTLCGVNLTACVIETVIGLITKGFTCQVVSAASAN